MIEPNKIDEVIHLVELYDEVIPIHKGDEPVAVIISWDRYDMICKKLLSFDEKKG